MKPPENDDAVGGRIGQGREGEGEIELRVEDGAEWGWGFCGF